MVKDTQRRYPGKPPRLRWVFDDTPLYFVTTTVKDRRPLLASQAVTDCCIRFAEIAYERFGIAVGRFVVMPDHVHLFVRGPIGFELDAWIQSLKAAITRSLRMGGEQGEIWQRGFFDHVLRSDESYGQK